MPELRLQAFAADFNGRSEEVRHSDLPSPPLACIAPFGIPALALAFLLALARHRAASAAPALGWCCSSGGYVRRRRSTSLLAWGLTSLAPSLWPFWPPWSTVYLAVASQVLECADGFKKYLEPQGVSLSEVDSHRLLEELGRAKTYQEMRDVIREIDQDSDGRVSLIEWLLFEFKKSVNEVTIRPHPSSLPSPLQFPLPWSASANSGGANSSPPTLALSQLFSSNAPPELAAIMKAAIDKWHAVHDKKNKKLSEVEELEALAAKGGIKGMQAKMKLAAIKQMGTDGNDNEEEIRAAVQKKKAESMVAKCV